MYATIKKESDMSNHQSNYPTERIKKELQKNQGFVSDTVHSIMEISKGTKPRNEAELQERITQYFNCIIERLDL